MSVVENMWAAVQAKQAGADAAGCGKEWAAMCKTRTLDSVNTAWAAAPRPSAFDDALWHVWETLDALREPNHSARRAIAALRKVTP